MNPSLQVYKKEIMEMLRDKRVRSGAFITPMFVVLMMVMLFGFIMESVGKKENIPVHFVKTSDPLMTQIRESKLQLHEISSEAVGKSLILSGKARLVVVFDKPKDFGNFQQKIIRLMYDDKEESAQIAKAQFMQALSQTMRDGIEKQLVAQGLPKEAAEPIKFEDSPVQVGSGKGASTMILSLLPYMIVLFAFTGGFSIASDIVAGEKEKSTLETLLITPASRTQIVLGKFFALMTVCFCSSMSALFGLVFASIAHLPGTAKMMESGLGLTPQSVVLMLGLLLPLVAFFAGILLIVSTYARNMREAQTYLALVNLVVLIPAVFSQMIGFTGLASQFWINLVPVLNTASNIRAALQGKTDFAAYGATAGIGIVLAAIAITIAIRMFNREKVLLRV